MDKVIQAHFKVNRYSILLQCFELLQTTRRPEDEEVDWEPAIDEAIHMANIGVKEYLDNQEIAISDEGMNMYFALRDAKHMIEEGISKSKVNLVKAAKDILESLGVIFSLKFDFSELSQDQLLYYAIVFPKESHGWRGKLSGKKFNF